MAKSRNGKAVTLNHIEAKPIEINTLDVLNPKGIAPTYSNNATVMFSPSDFRIIFTEILLDGKPTDTPKLEMRANVAISPTQFKALYKALGESIEKYEAHFGVIKWPQENQVSPKI